MGYKFIFKEQIVLIDNSWKELFEYLKDEIDNISLSIQNNYTPLVQNIFKVFELPLNKIKVIILGQDPYFQEGIATGRAFEISNYIDWTYHTENTSIRNILKELYREKMGLDEIKSLKYIREELNKNNFKILPPNELFEQWQSNGVLLLNTALTCELNKPISHKSLWCCFTKKVIEAIVQQPNEKYWLLWGKEAQEYKLLIRGKCNIIIEAPHPRKNEFVGSKAFSNVKDVIFDD